MSWAVLSYVVFTHLQISPTTSPAFWTLQVLMGLSRSYVGAHFPHQCFLGTVLGLAVAHSVSHNKTWLTYSRPALILLTFSLFLSVNILYLTLLSINMDPNWTLTYALQWCAGQH